MCLTEQMALTVTTPGGHQVVAVRESYDYVAEGECFRVTWRVSGISPESVGSVLFGLNH